jgi:polar amino acid transport system permease protein
MERIADFFRWLNDAHGVNLSIFYDAFDRSRFLEGLWTTVELSAVCTALSLAIGVLGAWLQGARFGPVRQLVQLFFFYFAIGNELPHVLDEHGMLVPPISNVGWAILSLSLFAGAFNVEIFRAGIEAVPRATVEAAESLGYSRLGIYWHVLLPLAFRISLPALNNNLVNLVKTTTLAYAIAVPELLYAAAQIWSEVLNVREMMNVLLVTYVALIAVLVAIMARWEHALRIPGYDP